MATTNLTLGIPVASENLTEHVHEGERWRKIKLYQTGNVSN